MTPILRRFRGLGVALAVLAVSAGAAFAVGPSLHLSSHAASQARTHATGVGPSGAGAAEHPDRPDAGESAEPSERPEASGQPDANTHGALVSAAAGMATPSGFRNHGAFVSCVAHLDAPLTGFDWSSVTPASCGIPAASPTARHDHASPQGVEHRTTGQDRGASHRAERGPTTQH